MKETRTAFAGKMTITISPETMRGIVRDWVHANVLGGPHKIVSIEQTCRDGENPQAGSPVTATGFAITLEAVAPTTPNATPNEAPKRSRGEPKRRVKKGPAAENDAGTIVEMMQADEMMVEANEGHVNIPPTAADPVTATHDAPNPPTT